MVRDKAKELLGLGLDNQVVADALGVTTGYIAQLWSEQDFRDEVQKLKLRNLAELAKRDQKWNETEDLMLDRLKEFVDSGIGFMTDPMKLLRALQVVNKAERRAIPAQAAATSQPDVVQLVVPITLMPQIVVNNAGQVTEVDGRVIATIPANVANKHLQAQKEEQLAADSATAKKRLSGLVRMDTLPVAEVL